MASPAKGEKIVQKFLVDLCFVLPAFSAFLSMFYLENMRGAIMCNGREEHLRFNLNNFLDSISDSGIVILLPLHHPYRLMALCFGRI